MKELSYNEQSGKFCHSYSREAFDDGYKPICRDLDFKIDIFEDFIKDVYGDNFKLSHEFIRNMWLSFDDAIGKIDTYRITKKQ